MPKVSVIIPVYGVEKYIERCARSLFEQTLDDIEYLFIDDCTPDSSIEVLKNVLEEYPNRKAQVIIHLMEHNSGQARVREWGIKNANGEYVIHCDSDDWVDNDMYEKLYNIAHEANSDIIISDFFRSDGSKPIIEKGVIFTEKEKLIQTFLLKQVSCAVWNKLVKRSLYNSSNIVYPIDNMGEDLVLMIQLVLLSKTISYVNEPLYFYYFNPNSICNTKTSESIYNKFFQLEHNSRIIIETMKRYSTTDILDNSIVKFMFDCKYLLMPLVFKERKALELWKNTYSNNDLRILMNPYLSLKNKLYYCIVLVASIFV